MEDMDKRIKPYIHLLKEELNIENDTYNEKLHYVIGMIMYDEQKYIKDNIGEYIVKTLKNIKSY